MHRRSKAEGRSAAAGEHDAMRDRFHRDGYASLGGVLDPTRVDELRREADALLRRAADAGRVLDGHWPGDWRQQVYGAADAEHQVLAVHNLEQHAAAFATLLFDQRVLDLVEAVLGGGDIQLYKTLLHAKPPRIGGAFPMHQDCAYLPHRTSSFVTVGLFLDAAASDNGGLTFVPGSHRGGARTHVQDGHRRYLSLDQNPLSAGVPLSAQPGDVVLFGLFTVHGSTPNGSDRWRRLLLYEFRAPDNGRADRAETVGRRIMVRGRHPCPRPRDGERY